MTRPSSIAIPTDRHLQTRTAWQPMWGTLRGEVSLTVQTRYGKTLITGRAASVDKPAIAGLLGFAERLKAIWQAAAADDAYADWWLIRIEEGLDNVRSSIASLRHRYQAIFEQHSALEIQVAASVTPYRASLRFANPYAYSAANLIGEFDHLACTLLTAQHVGLINQQTTHQALQLGARRLRQLLSIPQGFRALSIDRHRLQADPGAANAAIQAMGELPPEILAGERLPRLLPRNERPVEPARPPSDYRTAETT